MDFNFSPSTLSAIESSIWLSIFAAPLGSFLIFRRLSFFGDALGHSTMSGLALAFLFGFSSPFLLSLGALASVLVTAGLLFLFEKKAKLPSDVAMTVSYSGMFALGLLLLSGSELNLEHVLLGDIWTIQPKMLWFLRIWGLVVIAILWLGWRPLWSSVVDSAFAKTLGYNVQKIDLLFLALTSISVVGLIQSVGVILVTSYLVLPPAAALAWSKSLRGLVFLSALFALMASAIGLWLSVDLALPAGPAIAFSAFVLLIVSHTVAVFPPDRI